ncbi:MAG: nuclear transport factor 2 family protein [Candidatus Bathyarchaeia archaeon]
MTLPEGPQGVLAFTSDYIKANPQVSVDFKRIIAEGDLAAVHSHLKPNPQTQRVAVVDIFKVENGKLVEH